MVDGGLDGKLEENIVCYSVEETIRLKIQGERSNKKIQGGDSVWPCGTLAEVSNGAGLVATTRLMLR